MITKLKSLRSHQGFMKYFKNTSWLFGEKILRMVVGLFVGIWVARYLGPEQFGLLSYAQSFAGLFTAIATLGLDGIVVRELVKDESRRDELIGTAFWLKLMGAFAVIALLALTINFTSNDQYTNTLVFIIASATIFQSFNVVDLYFQSKVLSKYIVYANVISLLLSSIVKIALILNKASLEAFAWVVLFDSFVLACGFIYFYFRHLAVYAESKLIFKMRNLVFSKAIAISLLRDSWPLILGGILAMVYMKIDLVMIKNMLGNEPAGLYSAAIRISETLFFIFPVIINSMNTAVFNSLSLNDKKEKEKRIMNYYAFIFYTILIYTLVVYQFTEYIMKYTFGEQYSDSVDVLNLHLFSNLSAFIGGMVYQWYLYHNLILLNFYRAFQGALLNIILNYLLIPEYGIIGAAIATNIAYFYSAIIAMALNSQTRINLYLFLKSLLLPINYLRRRN